MKYGIQMYSLRDVAEVNLKEALKTAAEIGYKQIEFAGFFGNSAEDIKSWLDEYGLECSGTHSLIGELINNFDETVKFHKTIGNKYYIIPGHDLSTKEKLDEFIDQCNMLAPKLREHGIELGFHNHHIEFEIMPEGYQIHKELEERADIFFEIDTYWAFVGKQDPVATLERLKDRIRVIHLKDGSPEGVGCSLGSGSAPVAAVKAKAQELGFGIVVESESLNPSGPEEVKRCIEYLKSLD